MILWQRALLFYQTQRHLVDNGLQALGLTVLTGLVLQSSVAAVYPPQWVTVLLIGIFLLGTRSPSWGYGAAVITLLWPLWHISPYLMALFLAVTVLARGPILDNLPWALLVVATPLLAQGYLIALPPLVAGLLGGPTAGLWVGLLAALWAKLFGGMGGLPVDLLALNEYAFDANLLAQRFAGANSLETLRLLIAPFAAGSVVLLLHLLQILAWGLVGYAVGRVRGTAWTERAPWTGAAVAVVAGTATAWGGLYALPAWLQFATLQEMRRTPGTLVGLAAAALLTLAIYNVYHAARRPVFPRAQAVRVRRGWPVRNIQREGQTPPPRPTSADGQEDLIMIELD